LFERIVAGYAGERAGREALVLAAALAGRGDGALTVVFPYHPLLATRDAEEVQERVQSEVTALLNEVSARQRGEPLPEPTFHWSSASWPIHALHQLAAYEAADLIVFGAAPHGALGALHVSLMERMIHGAPCAVALAPSGYAAGTARAVRRIGVGFCDSEESHAAVVMARELADELGGELEMVAAAGLDPALASYAFSAPLMAEAQSEIEAEVAEQAEHAAAELRDGVEVRTRTVSGVPAEVLVERTKELDLLVLGSRAYGPLRHALLGSVSATVMRDAHCPVLVLPRGVRRREDLAAQREAQSQTT
jgi:nucleotide-binding universal stress UspA family protein